MTKPTDPRLQEMPEDALNYNDDVTAETVAKIREEHGVNLSSGEWETIDHARAALGKGGE